MMFVRFISILEPEATGSKEPILPGGYTDLISILWHYSSC